MKPKEDQSEELCPADPNSRAYQKEALYLETLEMWRRRREVALELGDKVEAARIMGILKDMVAQKEEEERAANLREETNGELKDV